MIIGVPKEVKDHEARVGLLPSGAKALVQAGHKVLAQSTAGLGSSLTDDEYRQAGAQIVETAAELWAKSDLVVKVKEPQPSEYPFLRPGLVLFTYLHLAPLPGLTDKLLESRVNGVAYETIRGVGRFAPAVDADERSRGEARHAGGRAISRSADGRPRGSCSAVCREWRRRMS